MYVVVFFLLVWTLCQLILCGARCTKSNPRQSEYYLLQTNDINHKQYNYHFKEILSKHGFHATILNDCSTNLTENMEDTKDLGYVINLYVGDFYQNNYNVVKKNKFIWAGDIGKGDEKKVCRTNKNVIKMNHIMETCKPYLELRKYVKLVSKKVTEIPELFDLVLNFEAKDLAHTRIDHYILVCTEKDENMSNHNTTLQFYDVTKYISYINYKCDKDTIIPPQGEVIAIVAPNPELIQETSRPVIFYEEPYTIPEATAFYNNSMMRVRSWKPMIDAFLLFLWEMKWSRVAILSDDSVESEAFEKELRESFDMREISYTVMSGNNEWKTNKCCDFVEALTSLKKAEARIIIANVAEQHVTTLALQAKYAHMTYSENIVWLARDWSEATARQVAQLMLSPVFSVYAKARLPIERHLQTIENVINMKRTNKTYNFYNEKQFADDIRQEFNRLEEIHVPPFYVTKTNFYGNHLPVRFGAGYQPFPDLPRDREYVECAIRSANYYKPCDDMDLIFYMLVIVVFAVTVLGITYFFHVPDNPPYNRM